MKHIAKWYRPFCVLLSVLIILVILLIVMALVPWWLTRQPSFGAPVTGQSTLVIEGPGGWVNRVAFSSNGLRLASAVGSSDAAVKIWNSETGELLRTLKSHKYDVYSVAFSLDGHYLASGGHDK